MRPDIDCPLVMPEGFIRVAKARGERLRAGWLVVSMSVGCASSMQGRAYDTPPSPMGCRKDVVADFGAHRASGDQQNHRFQSAVDAVAECGDGVGGVLVVPSGKYFLKGIRLRSHVHLQVDEEAIFHPASSVQGRGSSIFQIGMDAEKTVRNVSIVGTGSGFTFDLRTGGDREAAIHIGNTRNFKLSNFTVKDKETVLSSISFRISIGSENQVSWARDGIVERVHQTGADIGYGLIQTHALTNVLFDTISSEGGVALRLEPDTPRLRALGKGGVYDLRAHNVSCKNGLAAVMLSPHMTQNGAVTIDGVHATSCAFAVRAEPGAAEVTGDGEQSRVEIKTRVREQIGRGCVDAVIKRLSGKFMAVIKPDCADAAFRELGLKPGGFGRVVISDVMSIYGKNSQFKKKYPKFLSCREQTHVCIPQPERNRLRGGSIAAVYDAARGEKPGNYRIATRDVRPVGYPGENRTFVTPRSPTYICPGTEIRELLSCADRP